LKIGPQALHSLTSLIKTNALLLRQTTTKVSYYYKDSNWVQECQWRCICHESRCCGGLHTAAGCRAWSWV